jgi:oligopeptide/dipeptide ABC transporter ATP-binding protein
LRIRHGETLALVGESGSGKSVTSLAILGLLPPGSATMAATGILLRGRSGAVSDLSRIDKSTLRRLRGDEIAMIFQEPMTSLNPAYSVGKQISEVLEEHRGMKAKEARARAIAMLDRVGIPDAARRVDAYPHELSGGMRQRVMIAMSMICGPGLLIADEPTTALDVTIQAQILDEMRQLQNEFGMAMLFITHDLGVVAEIAQDVAVMYCGQIVETGSVASVLTHPLHPYTRGLLASVPRPDRPRAGSLQSIPGRVPDPRNLPPGCRFSPRCRFSVPGLCDMAVPALEDNGSGGAVRCVRWSELESEL